MVATLATLGIAPGVPFALAPLGADVAAALEDVPKLAFEKIMAHFKTAGRNENGWVFTTGTGVYGTDYLQRAEPVNESETVGFGV
jgi:hypothetical protein